MQANLVLVGRILVGLFYVMNGFNHFTKLEMLRGYAEASGVPAPTVAVLATGVLMLAAGLSILLGAWPKIGVAALVVFYIPVTFMMHPFWSFDDPQQAQQQMIHFMKNMALLGSALMYLGVPEPWAKSLGQKLQG